MKYLLLFLLLIPLASFAAPKLKTFTVTCDAPTTREDGSEALASEIRDYKFVLTRSTSITEITTVNRDECLWDNHHVYPGLYTLDISAFDIDDIEGDQDVSDVKVNARLSKVKNVEIIIGTIVVEVPE